MTETSDANSKNTEFGIMNEPETDSEFADEIARLKAGERRVEKQVWLTRLGVLLVGLAAGAGYYFHAIPLPGGRDHLSYAVIVGLVTTWLLLQFGHLLLPELGARCPKCSEPWVRDEETGSDWKSWKHCPGCGLKMDGR